MHTRFANKIHFPGSFLVLAILALIILAGWYFSREQPATSSKSSQSFNLQRTANEILADPIRYATNRFTGGIGVALIIDPATGLPMVNGVIPGSPAEAAGLARHDVLLEVNHISMKGKNLLQAVEMVRGLTVANVDILMQRNGTNLHCQVSRTSWTDLRKLGNITEFYPLPGVTAPRLVVPINPSPSLLTNEDLYGLPSALPLVETNF